MGRKRGRPKHDDILTPAEWRVVDWIRHGLTNNQIAELQSVSVDAVKYHVGNILQKLGARNRRALRGWVGAPRGSAIRGEARMGTMTLDGSIGQIARKTKDIDAAVSWYRDILGLSLLFQFEKLAFFDCNGVRLMLAESDEPAGESLIYFRVDDIEAAYESLVSRGAQSVSAPHKVHEHEDGIEEWMAFVNDPDGHPVGIISAVRH